MAKAFNAGVRRDLARLLRCGSLELGQQFADPPASVIANFLGRVELLPVPLLGEAAHGGGEVVGGHGRQGARRAGGSGRRSRCREGSGGWCGDRTGTEVMRHHGTRVCVTGDTELPHPRGSAIPREFRRRLFLLMEINLSAGRDDALSTIYSQRQGCRLSVIAKACRSISGSPYDAVVRMGHHR